MSATLTCDRCLSGRHNCWRGECACKCRALVSSSPNAPKRAATSTSERKRATDTHCANDHEWTKESTYIHPTQGRQCRVCKRKTMAEVRGRNATKTHCADGHEYTPENTYVDPDGRRHCRKCTARNKARFEAKRRGAA